MKTTSPTIGCALQMIGMNKLISLKLAFLSKSNTSNRTTLMAEPMSPATTTTSSSDSESFENYVKNLLEETKEIKLVIVMLT